MTRRKLPPLPKLDDDPNVRAVIDQLGAAELSPELVPPHWLDTEGPSFGMWVEGSQVKRPDWSRREAAKIAKVALQAIDMRHTMNAAMVARGKAPVMTIPNYLAVVVCPRCNELQMGGSADGKGNYCTACPPDPCPEGTRHKDSTRAPCCAVRMEVIWRTTDPIPEEWLK